MNLFLAPDSLSRDSTTWRFPPWDWLREATRSRRISRPVASPFDGLQTDPALNRTVGTDPVGMVKGDFNADGILDLATVNQGSGDISVLLGVGDGTFAGQQRFVVGGTPDAIATLDFNQDGRLDLAVRDSAAGTVTLLLGLGDGTFVQAAHRVPIDDPLVAGLFTSPPALSESADFARDGSISVASWSLWSATDLPSPTFCKRRPSSPRISPAPS